MTEKLIVRGSLTYKGVVDKKGWGEGPWDEEPDKIQWYDSDTHLPCLAVRHPRLGHWCGYVGVYEGHPLYGKGYQDLDQLDVHGGLTFSGGCDKESKPSKGICHVPFSGETRIWWLGFDCAHSRDKSPGLDAQLSLIDYLNYLPNSEYHRMEDTYRTLEYVKNECKALAKQVKEVQQIS